MGERGVYSTDLVKIKKAMAYGLAGYEDIRVRQLLTDPTLVEVTTPDEVWQVRIIQGAPLPDDEVEHSPAGYMWLRGHPPQGVSE